LARVFDDRWPRLELMDRMRHVTRALHAGLPADFRAAMDILKAAAPTMQVSGFVLIVPSDYAATFGLHDLDAAIPALEVFTQRMSAEFAVRPFIVRYPERMMRQMLAWASHPSEHVRRLASEGSRPRLPWGMALPALKKDPSPLFPILDRLKADPSETVRRSVANNLNDIAKDNPERVIETLRRWREQGDSPTLQALTRHALRTLVKAGHPGALDLLGLGTAPRVEVRGLTVAPAAIPEGGAVTFSFEIASLADEPQTLVIDYVVHLVRARGKISEKVFKLTKRTLGPGEAAAITRRHSFAPVTTRRYYPGRHAIQIKINGQLHGLCEFHITAAPG
ncbi:MAG: DNA alkylation repair protein, partial [Anaerolineae bacterium]|nr:DNA alkylation repair protein [Anaerolineae bacterium]